MKLKIDSTCLILLFMILISLIFINIEYLIKPIYNEFYRIFLTTLIWILLSILTETKDKKFIKVFYNLKGIISSIPISFVIAIILSYFMEFNDS
ncbi:hypothetical protein GY409_001914, partial [Campylobacter jejuni]|nr:hypothetical protein [Campylobacter jejuni]